MSSSWLLDSFGDTEIEVANILLQLPSLIIIKPVVPGWGFRRRRSAINIENSPLPTANHSVDSQVENSSCGVDDQSEAPRPVSDDRQHVEIEENSSKLKAESAAAPGPGLEVEPTRTPCNNPNATLRIRIKLREPEKPPGIHIKDGDQTFGAEAENHPEGAMDRDFDEKTCINKRFSLVLAREAFEEGLAELAVPKGCLVRESGEIKEEPTRVLEADTITPTKPPKRPAKRKSREELENEVTLWEDHKTSILESIHKVKDYLEKQKALNVHLKACKLRYYSSSKEKSDSR